MASTSGKKSENNNDARQAVLLLEEKIFVAVKSRDASVLERVLAEDFVYRSADQEVTRDDFLMRCSRFPYEIVSIRGEDLKVNFYGEIAVVTGLQFADTKTDDGRIETSVVAFTDVFVKQNGDWSLCLARAVDLPQAPNRRS
ncbi:MAG: nuclear transport factor 2 family protein [Chloracidobacterium sp.]|nr:nuclear transport factor 2 family protein [Chloracidobacterium sp.]